MMAISISNSSGRAPHGRPAHVLGFAVVAVSAVLAGCQELTASDPPTRPVRSVVVARHVVDEPVTLTGQVQAQEEANLAFRIGGRVIERLVDVDDVVKPGQVLARLDPRPEQDALRSAEAAVAAAQAQFVQARNTFDRQSTLLDKGFTTRVSFDQAQQQLQSAQSQVDSTEAQLRTARDRLTYTDLKADAAGVVTTRNVEPGEVVGAGQLIVKVARQSGRDAVFEVPASLIRATNRDIAVKLALTDDPAVRATGRVREVAPQANPATRTFRVKVGVTDPPPSMRLGATVTGSVNLSTDEVLSVPASALTQSDGQAAVWTVHPQTKKVAIRIVQVLRYEPASVIISSGLEPGEVVVTAGVQTLRPGQTIRLLGEAS
jgi:membrane fusion protein, multidrug efflux system